MELTRRTDHQNGRTSLYFRCDCGEWNRWTGRTADARDHEITVISTHVCRPTRCTKVGYPTNTHAQAALAEITRRHRKRKWVGSLEHPHPPCATYLHDACKQWHLTSERQDKRETA